MTRSLVRFRQEAFQFSFLKFLASFCCTFRRLNLRLRLYHFILPSLLGCSSPTFTRNRLVSSLRKPSSNCSFLKANSAAARSTDLFLAAIFLSGSKWCKMGLNPKRCRVNGHWDIMIQPIREVYNKPANYKPISTIKLNCSVNRSSLVQSKVGEVGKGAPQIRPLHVFPRLHTAAITIYNKHY